MTSIFKRIDTVFLKVNDFDKSIAWYCTVLGFTLRWKQEEGGYAALNIGETPLTLVRTSEQINRDQTHISFNFFSADIEGAHQCLVQNNVMVEPLHEEGGVKWFEFLDIEGNKLGVCHFKE